ncbi:MAG TPA: hypothetical protein VFS44_08190, partial [Gemmatimonadaceae bacterium]|nr:hypothetical protein [Gemmatimonadaceae bacterium]
PPRAAGVAWRVLMVAAAAGCGSSGAVPASGANAAHPAPAQTAAASAHGDSSAGAPVPPGYGSLRQEDVSVTVRLPLVLVRAIPLDESIIRLLSPDSYRALRQLRDGKRDVIARASARLGVQRPSLWYLSYFGLQPDAAFSSRDVQIVSGGREFRPLELIPLTAGFGSERVGQREVQSAIYLFDQGIDPNQPLTVTVQSVPGSSWSAVIPVIERERALVRTRVP